MCYSTERVRRNQNIHLLAAAVVFFLTLSSLTVLAQTVDKNTLNVDPATAPSNDLFDFPQVLSTGFTGAVVGNNISASKELGEPNHAGNVGGHSVWYSWTAPSSYGMTFTLRTTSTNFDTLLAVYSGPLVYALTQRAANDDYGRTPGFGQTSTVFFPTVAGTNYRIAVDGYNGASGAFVLSWNLSPINRFVSSFTGTGISSATIFRPSTGTWWTTSSTGAQALTFGTNGDVPTPADFDGDTITDYAVFRNGQWHVLKSFDNTYIVFGWGSPGDKPMPGDYDANGYDDYAVFRPSNGTWYVRDGRIPAIFSQQFGLNGDKPAARDYDGDGRFDLAVYRPSTGVWYIFNSYTQSVSIVNWGLSEDIPMPSEYGLDGITDIAVWRPSNGTWYVRQSTGSIRIQPFGLSGDIPQVLDYGNGASDFAVFRPSTGVWYTLDVVNGSFAAFQWGIPGDIPASSYPIQQ